MNTGFSLQRLNLQITFQEYINYAEYSISLTQITLGGATNFCKDFRKHFDTIDDHVILFHHSFELLN